MTLAEQLAKKHGLMREQCTCGGCNGVADWRAVDAILEAIERCAREAEKHLNETPMNKWNVGEAIRALGKQD